MAVEFKFEIDGTDDITKEFKAIGARMGRKAVLAAMRKAAKPIVKQAKANAHERTGTLKKSIGIVTVPKKKAFNTIIDIGPRVSKSNNAKNSTGETDSIAYDGWYGFLEEFFNNHPFLRPALDSKASEAIKIFGKEIAKQIFKRT